MAHQTATFNLTLTGAGDDLAGFQCDVEFDSEALEIAFAAGPASIAAGKSVVVTPLASGKRRLLVAGLNQRVIRDGAVVVLTVRVNRAGKNVYDVRLSNAAATTSEGSLLAVGAESGSVVTEE